LVFDPVALLRRKRWRGFHAGGGEQGERSAVLTFPVRTVDQASDELSPQRDV